MSIGNGTVGLSADEKQERLRLYLGDEASKVKGMPNASEDAVELSQTPYAYDKIPQEILDNLDKYPNAQGDSKHKVLHFVIRDDGTMEFGGVINDSRINDPQTRSMFSVVCLSDELLAELEQKQINSGELTEYNERTKQIHENNNVDLSNYTEITFGDWKG